MTADNDDPRHMTAYRAKLAAKEKMLADNRARNETLSRRCEAQAIECMALRERATAAEAEVARVNSKVATLRKMLAEHVLSAEIDEALRA